MAGSFLVPGNAASSSPANYAPSRPAASTWQDSQYQQAQDLWNKQGAGVYGGASDAYGAQQGAIQNSAAALTQFNAYAPTNIAGFNPTDLAGFDASKYLKGAGSGASDLAKQYASGGGGGTIAAQGSKALQNVDFSNLTDFDPSAAGATYAKGALADFNTNLDTQLSALERKSAGTGRLETGFYTGDQGTVATNLGKDFNAKLMEAAQNFSGQKLQALTAGDQLSLSRAQDIDSSALSSRAEADQTTSARQAAAINALLSEQGMNVGEQEQAAGLGLTRANELSSFGYQRARDTDTLNLQRSTTGLNAAMDEERMARQGYQSAQGAAADYTSATRNWAANDKQTQDMIDFESALAKFYAGMGGKPSGPGGVTLPGNAGNGGSTQTQDPYAYYKSLANATGVPFIGPTG